MNDRSWILNAAAIKAAKECIHLVRKELNVKLLLSHPEFIEMLNEYVELTESRDLDAAYNRLKAFANLKQNSDLTKTGASITEQNKIVAFNKAESVSQSTDSTSNVEMVTYGHKQFPRWRDGKEFSGLYRGQPNYS